MSSQSHNWWLLVLVAAASVVTAAGFGRRSLHSWTRHKWERQCQAQLAALSEQRAARLVQQLADADGEGLAAVVAACGDPRQAVAHSAGACLQALLERWSHLPPAEAAPRAAAMARLLAQHATRMAPPQRELAQSLAQRLLDWPIDSRQIDLAQFIADCDSVLRLPSAPPEELRLAAAAAPEARAAEVPAQPLEISQPQPVQPPELIAPPIPKNAAPSTPPAAANREAPEEPKCLVPPQAKSMRISDD